MPTEPRTPRTEVGRTPSKANQLRDRLAGDIKWTVILNEALAEAADAARRDVLERIRARWANEPPVHLDQARKAEKDGNRIDDCLYRGDLDAILDFAVAGEIGADHDPE